MTGPSQNQLVLHERIYRVGTIGRTLCTVILVVDGLTACVGIANSFATKTQLPPYFFIGAPYWAVGVLIMRRLFILLSQQQLFTAQSARLIQWLGAWHLLWGIRVSSVFDKVSDMAFGYQIQPGLILNFKPEFILTGLFLLAFGWGMNVAAALKQEQDLTI